VHITVIFNQGSAEPRASARGSAAPVKIA